MEHVVHITPPSNIESYMQETGRAGRTGVPSKATLYYNNSDIAKNKEHVHVIIIIIIISESIQINF